MPDHDWGSRADVQFLQELVRLPTINPPGDECLAADVIESRLEPLGFRIDRIAPAPGRDSIVATLPGTGDGPTLIFNGHTDVQPPGTGWTYPPFGAEIVGDRLYGRGSRDMKAGVAAFILAAESIAKSKRPLRGTLVLQCVADEVSGGVQGTGYVVEQLKPRADFAVVCEPTGLDVYIAHRGMVWFELSIHGKSAHSGRPWMGVNAISKAVHIIAALEQQLGPRFQTRTHPMLPSPSINIGRIEGGEKENLVAAACVVRFDRRSLPGETPDEIEAEIRQVIEYVCQQDEESWTFSLQQTVTVPGLEVSPDEPIVRACQSAYHSVTGDVSRIGATSGFEDAHWLVQGAGIPTAMFGPYVNKRWEGEGRFASISGQPDEFIEIPQWLTAIQVYEKLARDLLE